VFSVMNKASRVTLWADQPAHQIVKYTFENITPNFIPANFLASVTAANATMTMGQPFPDVWLPRGIDHGVHGDARHRQPRPSLRARLHELPRGSGHLAAGRGRHALTMLGPILLAALLGIQPAVAAPHPLVSSPTFACRATPSPRTKR